MMVKDSVSHHALLVSSSPFELSDRFSESCPGFKLLEDITAHSLRALNMG